MRLAIKQPKTTLPQEVDGIGRMYNLYIVQVCNCKMYNMLYIGNVLGQHKSEESQTCLMKDIEEIIDLIKKILVSRAQNMLHIEQF